MIWRHAATGVVIFSACLILAACLRAVIPLPVPTPLWGMAILFLVCWMQGRVPASLRSVGEFLLRHMPLFFIPAIIGVLVHEALIWADGGVLFLALMVSTAIGLVVTAGLFMWLRPGSDERASVAADFGE